MPTPKTLKKFFNGKENQCRGNRATHHHHQRRGVEERHERTTTEDDRY